MAADSSSGGTAFMVASVVVASPAIISVALRFHIRMRMKVGIAWDDWWILIGLLTAGMTAALLLCAVYLDPAAEGAFRDAMNNNSVDTFDTTPHMTYLKLTFIVTALYFTIVTAIKVSILLMYRRIFSIDESFRLQSLLVGVVVLAFWIAATIATLLHCRPMNLRWISLSDEHCFNLNLFWMVTGVVEVVIDTVILALPVRMVLGLNLSRKDKVSVVFVFLLGGFVIATGIMRVVNGYVPGGTTLVESHADVWGTLHIGMAIICACLPILRPLLARPFSLVTNTSSTIRKYYHSLLKYSSKSGSGSDPSASPSTEVAVETSHLKFQERHRSAGPNGTRTETTELEPLKHQEGYCGANLTDPRVEPVWVDGRASIRLSRRCNSLDGP